MEKGTPEEVITFEDQAWRIIRQAALGDTGLAQNVVPRPTLIEDGVEGGESQIPPVS